MPNRIENQVLENATVPMIPSISCESRARLPADVRARLEALESAESALRHEVDRLSIFQQLAYRDDLTGLYNRRHFDERLAQEWSRSNRFDEALTLLLIDLDGFKLVNDLAGHATGDEVLRFVAKHMLASCRRFDIACRLGGDEFAFILPGTTAVGARALIARISNELARATERPALPAGIGIGLSFGISERCEASSSSDLFERADAGMYVIKRQHKSEQAPPSGVCSMLPGGVYAA